MLKRNITLFKKKIMNDNYRQFINKDNIESLSKRKIDKMFSGEDPYYRNMFLHNVIDEWFSEKEQTLSNLKKLKKIIKKTKIILNQVEKHNINLIEERAFSLERHIKVLDVNMELPSKEHVGVNFQKANIYTLQEGVLKIIFEGTLLLTNRRIIMTNDSQTLNFYWTKITKKKYKEYGFSFVDKSIEYVIRIHDQITLNNTIKNFRKKKGK